MLDLISSSLYVLMALLGFGFVVAIHELGHFVFAKWAGVRVDTFSIGFPLGRLPPMVSWRYGETVYQIAWLPFGGYVKMLGQEDVPTEADKLAPPDPRSYLAKSAGWKALILLGGVLFNLISSLIILFALAAWDMPVFRPMVGEVEATIPDQHGRTSPSPATRLGLKRGDVILSVNGERVRSFDDVITDVLFSGNQPLTLVIQRDGDKKLTLPAPGAEPVKPAFDGRWGRPSLGIAMPGSNRVVVVSGTEAGLNRLDRLIAIDGEDVSELVGQEIQDRLLRHLGQKVRLTIERGGQRQDLDITYAGQDEGFDSQAGVPVVVTRIDADGPAGRAGLQVDDVVESIDGTAVAGVPHLMSLIRRGLDSSKGAIGITVLRGSEHLSFEVGSADYDGVRRIGIGRGPLEGPLPFFAPAIDGKPTLLEQAGLKVGDTPVAWRPGEKDVKVAWVRGGERKVFDLGLDSTAWEIANRVVEPSIFQRIAMRFGAVGPPRPLILALDQVRVREVGDETVVVCEADPDAKPVRLAATRFGPVAKQLQAGDWIISAHLAADGMARVDVLRGAGEPSWATLETRPIGTAFILDQQEERPYHATSAGDAVGLVHDASYNLVVKSVLLLPRLFRSAEQGGVDANKTLTGPIGIFRALKSRIEMMGLASFLKLLALVGLNLFVVNLLPIPITDGGQLLMLGVESAIRRPLPERLRNLLMYAGVGLVGALFLYVCGLDLLRLIGLA